MKIIFATLIIILITSCNNSMITDIEKKSVEKVLDFYGGICNRNKGFNIKNGITETYFKLELSKSELLESYSEITEMPASNIAYIFFSNLNEEQDNYTQIKVQIILSDRKSETFIFDIQDLIEIETFIPLIENISEDIKEEKYSKLISKFDESATSSINTLIIKNYCQPFDSLYGKPNKIEFQGFSFITDKKENKELVLLGGVMIREKENTPISILVDRKSKKLLTMKYNL